MNVIVCDVRTEVYMRQIMHVGLVGVLRSILRDVGIPGMGVVTEARGLI